MKYEIIRSSRKSVSVCISPENRITVRCPVRMTEKQIEEFVLRKKDWINKIIVKNTLKLSENQAVLDRKEIYAGGTRKRLILADKNEITNDTVFVKDYNCIKNLYISEFSEEFLSLVKRTEEEVKIYASGLKIKSYKSRWGCCDAKHNISFNYLLFMLPPSIQKYVIIHELCHIIVFNHSFRFWKLVESFLPDFKNLRKQLKSFDYLINLY